MSDSNVISERSVALPDMRWRKSREAALLFLARAAFAGLLLGIWQLVVNMGLVHRLFLVGPVEVVRQLWAMILDGSLWFHTLETMKVAAGGFTLGMVVGTLLGYVIGLNRPILLVVRPFVTILNAAPRIALAPLFVLWFGIGTTSGIALVFLTVVFIALTNTISGTLAVERNFILLAKLYGASRYQMIRNIVLPSTVPWIMAAARLAVAFSLTGAVVSQMFLGQKGLGWLIVAGGGVFNISTVFAAIVTTMFCAWILDMMGTWLEARVLRWRPSMH